MTQSNSKSYGRQRFVSSSTRRPVAPKDRTALTRQGWLAQTGRLLAQHRAITLDDPLLRSPAAVLAAGGLVADYELDRPDPIDGRAAAATAMADHEARRAIAVTAALQALPLHRRLVASRADLEADYDTSHLCVCPRCATPANDDDPHAVWGAQGLVAESTR